MKRFIVIFTVLLVFSTLLIIPASADMGPKPSVRISFPEASGSFYVTLLSENASTGPYSGHHLEYERDMIEDEKELAVFDKFATYIDEDGFWFLGFMMKCDANNGFAWTYYPPDTFKVLAYFPDTDSFVISSTYSRYAFESTYKAGFNADYSGMTVVDMQTNLLGDILRMLLRLTLTLLIELLIAIPFGLFANGPRKVVIITNVITQVLLNVGLYFADYYGGLLLAIFIYIFAEMSVFFIEGIVYSVAITPMTPPTGKKPYKGWKLWLYSLVANSVSFGIGLLLQVV